MRHCGQQWNARWVRSKASSWSNVRGPRQHHEAVCMTHCKARLSLAEPAIPDDLVPQPILKNVQQLPCRQLSDGLALQRCCPSQLVCCRCRRQFRSFAHPAHAMMQQASVSCLRIRVGFVGFTGPSSTEHGRFAGPFSLSKDAGQVEEPSWVSSTCMRLRRRCRLRACMRPLGIGSWPTPWPCLGLEAGHGKPQHDILLYTGTVAAINRAD